MAKGMSKSAQIILCGLLAGTAFLFLIIALCTPVSYRPFGEAGEGAAVAGVKMKLKVRRYLTSVCTDLDSSGSRNCTELSGDEAKNEKLITSFYVVSLVCLAGSIVLLVIMLCMCTATLESVFNVMALIAAFLSCGLIITAAAVSITKCTPEGFKVSYSPVMGILAGFLAFVQGIVVTVIFGRSQARTPEQKAAAAQKKKEQADQKKALAAASKAEKQPIKPAAATQAAPLPAT